MSQQPRVDLDRYRDAAIRRFSKKGVVEIKPTAAVMPIVGGGAFVEAWMWIGEEDVDESKRGDERTEAVRVE